MNKSYFALLAAAMLASCSENEITTPQKPSTPGAEVNFTLHLDNAGLSTRTIYGNEEVEMGSKVFPIFWVEGDMVTMASPQATVKNATYAISVEEGAKDQNYASAMTKIGAAGIQWGAEFPQNFYSIYPAQYTENNKVVTNSISTDAPNAPVATLHIRDTQIQRFEFDENTNTWKGTPVDQDGMTSPDAIMYAQKKMTENGDVTLKYIPLATAFNITLAGYELSTGFDSPIAIQEVIIEAPENIKLVGDFKATFDASATADPVVSIDNSCTTTNVLHVPCLKDGANYLTPGAKEKICFNVFAIPDPNNTELTAEGWKIYVKTNYKTYTRNLVPAETTGAGTIVPGQVHKINVDKTVFITIPDETTLNTETWMKSIPRNVYITDISLPGAWYSRQAQYQGNSNGTPAGSNDDTGWTIQELWDKGVRAFSVETRSSHSGGVLPTYPYNPNAVVISGTGANLPNGSLINPEYYYRNGTNVSDVMAALCDALSGADGSREISSGYAVLMISYADGGQGGHRAQDYAFWLQGLFNSYNSLTDAQKAHVYGSDGQTLDYNTTIGDVQGKLIIQVNVASGLPGGDITKGNYVDDSLPALFTYVNRKRPAGTAPISEMHWKKWDDSYMNNVVDKIEDSDNDTEAYNKLNETLQSGKFYCNYSMANRTQLNTGSDEELPTYATRETTLRRILRNSTIALRLNRHNLWSIFAAGGTEAVNNQDDTTVGNALDFANNMNQWVLDQLNDRINSGKYGPFGIVFCNYIANNATHENVTVDGTQIIERILRMNQLFRLSRDEDKPERPDEESGTTTPSAANYSSSLSKDENGWNAF